LPVIINTLKDLLTRSPFEPFQILTSSGRPYLVAGPDLVVLLKSDIFVAAPDRDHVATIPYLHIAAVESISNDHRKRSRRRK